MVEQRLDRLEDGKPDVIAERVTRLSSEMDRLRRDLHEEIRDVRDDDIASLREELATQRKILIGAWVSIATGLIIAYALGQGGIGA